MQSYDEYVAYSKYLTKFGCELSENWVFVEPVVTSVTDQDKKIRQCVEDNMPSRAKIQNYFYMADLSDDGYLNIDELYDLYN